MSQEKPQAAEANDISLPLLREELQLQEGIRDVDGHRTWTLFDPIRNRYFQLTELDFTLLSFWHLRTSASVLEAMRSAHFPVDAEYLNEFVRFLVVSELVVAHSGVKDRLVELDALKNISFFTRVLHAYLSFRVPLIRPDGFLNWLYPRSRFLFSFIFIRISLLVGGIGLFLIIRQRDVFFSSFQWFFSPSNIAIFFVCLACIKIVHEFGHALMCKHFGLRVPTMGVAFLVMWPVLYTDASDAWRLRSRRQRAMISFAGVLTETVIVCYAMLAWALLPDGLVRGLLFAVITTVWVGSLAVNLNPVMKFDGYYFFSDILNVPNLQDRSFALARWWLRRMLFGVEAPAPEGLRPSTFRIMLVYAFFVWIYRLILFFGIALLVYHFFFKALGIFLFCVEIWWFIMKPIWSEIRNWRGLWPLMGESRRKAYQCLLLVVAVVLVYPWQTELHLPAQMQDAESLRVFPVRAAQIVSVSVRDGQKVAAGEVVASLRSAELDHQLRQAEIEVQVLQDALNRFSSSGHADGLLVQEQDLARAISQRDALKAEVDRLLIRSPYAAVVKDIDGSLLPGRWVSSETRLFTLVGQRSAKVVAWIEESDLPALPSSASARFYPDTHLGLPPVQLELVASEHAVAPLLDTPYQASVYGGSVPVRQDHDGRLVPELAIYRLDLDVTDGSSFHQLTRGQVTLAGKRRTLIGRVMTYLLGVLIRESGF
ncbi:MAG: biotin/lipoyl-binding protein [Pedobacter sp.]|nr:biotin/lipoyl-binding protein [Pedobacter sp.]